MPRFNSDRYTTAQDSSPGFKTFDPEYVVLLLSVKDNGGEGVFGCPCGCGGWPLGDKAKFAMGHDARLRGILIRAHLMGREILYVMRPVNTHQSIRGVPLTAAKVAEKYDWTKYLDEAVLKREGKNREVLQRALGSERLVQVGRWEYTGQVAAVYRDHGQDMLVIEYVNRAGEVKRTRVRSDQARAVA